MVNYMKIPQWVFQYQFFFIYKKYTKGQVNCDKGYNFTNVNGLIINKQVWAHPIDMDNVQQVLDNDTANPKWIGKV